MKSSSGEYFIALDHLRALAAFMVFSWHFTHAGTGYPVPMEYVPAIPFLAFLDEGHTGVALFMTLTGYLFAKLLDGKQIIFREFLRNRALRLLPLLAFIIAIVAVQKAVNGESLLTFMYYVAAGAVAPTLPNGGWSITAEFHFYVILPLLLWTQRKAALLPLAVLFGAILVRVVLHDIRGESQSLGYWTIVGRIDQFILGMMAFQFRNGIARRHLLAVGGLCAFAMFYWYIDLIGGLLYNPSWPSPNMLWVIVPTIEGLGYALLVAYYDTSFSPSAKGISKVVGRFGEYSYSIYLFHFFFVFAAARFIHENLMDISNFYVAQAWALVCFVLMAPVGYLSFRFIEGPFLRLRRRYAVAEKT
jgi:peptidoglycan/LPS O-acetylase OafA/YrhL